MAYSRRLDSGGEARKHEKRLWGGSEAPSLRSLTPPPPHFIIIPSHSRCFRSAPHCLNVWKILCSRGLETAEIGQIGRSYLCHIRRKKVKEFNYVNKTGSAFTIPLARGS